MLKIPAHPDKPFACRSDVLVAALEFGHVSVLALGDGDLYLEIHSLVLRFCYASAQADARALELAPIIAEMRAKGITEPGAIAKALTARGVPTARGHRFWTYNPARALLNRLDRLAGAAQPRGAGSYASAEDRRQVRRR
jgi:hypothetical protein